ncbi:MAG: hypothetical protein WCK51_05620 [Armatimonadota bacterium]
MKIRTQSLFAVGIATALIGCGGSGTTTPLVTLDKSSARAAVKEAAGSVQSVKSSNAKLAREASSKLSLQSREHDGDGEQEGGGGTEGGNPNGIWYKTTKEEYGFANGNEFRSVFEGDMFSDAEHINKIGYQNNYVRYEDVVGFNETDYHFTSGIYAPNRYKSSTMLNPISGKSSYETLIIDKGDDGKIYETISKFKQESWESKTEFEISFSVGGSRYIFIGSVEDNGVVQSSWTNSLGYKINWRVNQDGSGSIRLENANNPLCPATGEYGVDGKGTLTFADGTQEAFDMNAENFWQ